MGKIIPFPAKQPSKFGFERVRRRGEENRAQPGQELGLIRRLAASNSYFEEALFLDEHNDSRAEAAYLKAIAEGNNVADAYCNLGIIESKAGRIPKAFDCFTKALEYDPRHLEAHYNLGNLYFEADNLRLARMHYEFAVEIAPEYPNVYFNLGLVLALMEEPRAAIEAFSKYQLLASVEECGKADDLIRELKRSLTVPDRNAAE
jgi:tetratricopeptide (TPR) repeat protein